MPNLLLIGGTDALYQRLKSDSRWTVLRAVRDDDAKAPLDVLGDPRRWHLVIDEGHRYDGVHKEGAPPTVSTDYIGEANAARIVEVVTPEGNGLAQTRETEGHYTLEFKPTDEPEAGYLSDFVNRFASRFERVHLYIKSYQYLKKMMDAVGGGPRMKNYYRPVYVDYYGNPLIMLGDFAQPILYICDLPDDDVRADAILHIIQKTVPKLWPEAIFDLFRPVRIAELDMEEEQLVAAFRVKMEAIDTKREAEKDFYSPYLPLTELGDDELKLLVRKASREVFGFDVLDLDEDTTEGEAKNLDLLLRESGLQIVIEVGSSGTRGVKKVDLEDLDDHMPRVIEKYGRIDAKVLIYNGFIRRPELRTLEKMFSEDVVREAKAREICLMSSSQLLSCIERVRNGDIQPADLFEAFKSPGLIGWGETKAG